MLFRIESVYCESSRIEAKVLLRNVSKQWLWVRAMATLGLGPSLFFEVKDTSSGKNIEYSAKGDGQTSVTDYVSLGPGAEIGSLATVLRISASDTMAGVWRISARYIDTRRLLPEPPEWSRWFSGELRASSVDVELTSQDGELKCSVVSQIPT
jgi:hypothetical protein